EFVALGRGEDGLVAATLEVDVEADGAVANLQRAGGLDAQRVDLDAELDRVVERHAGVAEAGRIAGRDELAEPQLAAVQRDLLGPDETARADRRRADDRAAQHRVAARRVRIGRADRQADD